MVLLVHDTLQAVSMIKVLGMGAMGIFIVGIVGIEDKAVIEVASLNWLLVQGSAERLESSGKVAPVFCMSAPATLGDVLPTVTESGAFTEDFWRH